LPENKEGLPKNRDNANANADVRVDVEI